MKSILKSELIALLDKHRDNDIYVDFEGYEIPIRDVYYHPEGDQIRVRLDAQEVKAVKMLIKESTLRGNLSDAVSKK